MFVEEAHVKTVFLKNKKKLRVVPGTFVVDDDGSYNFEFYDPEAARMDSAVTLSMSVAKDFVSGIEMSSWGGAK